MSSKVEQDVSKGTKSVQIERNGSAAEWKQAKVLQYYRSELAIFARALKSQKSVRIKFATRQRIEIRPLENEREDTNIWILAAKRFSTHPYSNGNDGKYQQVKEELRRRWGYTSLNTRNKPILKYLAQKRGEVDGIDAMSVLRMRHALRYRLVRERFGDTESDVDVSVGPWRSARRRFTVFDRNGRYGNHTAGEFQEMRRGLVFVDDLTQREFKVDISAINVKKRRGSGKSSLWYVSSEKSSSSSSWRVFAFFSNLRFSKCSFRRFHEPVQDLMEGDLKSKIILKPGVTTGVVRRIKRDSAFLMRHGIMDYSLLIGVQNHVTSNVASGASLHGGLPSRHMNSKTYYMGVIDILRVFNFQKAIENFNKQYLLCRGKRISAVRPPTYKMYFDQYIESHVFATMRSLNGTECSQRVDSPSASFDTLRTESRSDASEGPRKHVSTPPLPETKSPKSAAAGGGLGTSGIELKPIVLHVADEEEEGDEEGR
eukprot:g2053.t1